MNALPGVVDPNDKYRHALTQIFMLIGLRTESIPEGIELNYLVGYIKTYLKKWIPEDFIRAFTLCVQGKLDTETRHFQNFTISYLEQIMVAYSAYLHIESKQEVNQLPEHEITAAEKDSFLKASCISAFNDYRCGKDVLDNGNPKYDWLDKNGYIPFDITLKWRIMNDAIAETKSKLQVEMIKKPNDRFKIQAMLDNIHCMDFQSRAVSLAKYKALLIFFNDLLLTGQMLEDLIEFHDRNNTAKT